MERLHAETQRVRKKKMYNKTGFNEIKLNMIIPDYQPVKLPYSQWERYRNIALLEANGYANRVEEWRKATENNDGLIRSSAYYLLIGNNGQEDVVLFYRGLKDMDETVQVLCAFGLFNSGDQSNLMILERLSQLDINAHIAATTAAGILGQLGYPRAFTVIEKGLKSELNYIRIFAIHNAMFFFALHGKQYDKEKKIDIWSFYRDAVKNEDPNVRAIAIAQLKEINAAVSNELFGE